MKKCKVGFIGYGNMARAIADSLRSNDDITEIFASDISLPASEGRIAVLADNASVVRRADYVFLSVKPQSAAEAFAGLDFGGKIVISIMAGKSLADIEALCNNATKIVRVMPNLCARVKKAVNAYCTKGLTADEEETVAVFLNSFGLAAALDESYFDTITGLTGSSPAYSFRYAKALVECGIKHGLPFEQSKELVLYCVSACMDVLRSANSVEEMQTTIDNVCSKGGTTIEGIYRLDAGNFDEVVISAVDAAIAKSAALGKK